MPFFSAIKNAFRIFILRKRKGAAGNAFQVNL